MFFVDFGFEHSFKDKLDTAHNKIRIIYILLFLSLIFVSFSIRFDYYYISLLDLMPQKSTVFLFFRSNLKSFWTQSSGSLSVWFSSVLLNLFYHPNYIGFTIYLSIFHCFLFHVFSFINSLRAKDSSRYCLSFKQSFSQFIWFTRLLSHR